MALIGFISKTTNSSNPGACDSYVGGSLVHFDGLPAPTEDLLTCKVCRGTLCFLARIYCPLSDSPFHRILCLFVCLRPACQEQGLGWRVLRSQYAGTGKVFKSDTANDWVVENDEEEEDPDEQDWGEDVEVICQNEESNASGSVVLHGPFVCSFIDVYEESCDGRGQSGTVEATSPASGSAALDRSSFAAWLQADAIEREFIEEDDNTVPNAFSGALETHLANRGEHGCEDVRYWWAGEPVFNGPPPTELAQYLTCSRCGSKRVFELQLFPTINNNLTLTQSATVDRSADFDLPDEEDQLNPSWLLRITTVLVFSCSASCWAETDKWAEECVVVQTDRDRTCIWDGTSPVVCSQS